MKKKLGVSFILLILLSCNSPDDSDTLTSIYGKWSYDNEFNKNSNSCEGMSILQFNKNGTYRSQKVEQIGNTCLIKEDRTGKFTFGVNTDLSLLNDANTLTERATIKKDDKGIIISKYYLSLGSYSNFTTPYDIKNPNKKEPKRYKRTDSEFFEEPPSINITNSGLIGKWLLIDNKSDNLFEDNPACTNLKVIEYKDDGTFIKDYTIISSNNCKALYKEEGNYKIIGNVLLESYNNIDKAFRPIHIISFKEDKLILESIFNTEKRTDKIEIFKKTNQDFFTK